MAMFVIKSIVIKIYGQRYKSIHSFTFHLTIEAHLYCMHEKKYVLANEMAKLRL